MESVDVLARIHPQQNAVLVHPRRERKLHQDAVDGVVGVQAVDEREDLFFRSAGGKTMRLLVKPDLAAPLLLVRDIDGRRRILTDQNHGQSWRALGPLHQRGEFLEDPIAYRRALQQHRFHFRSPG